MPAAKKRAFKRLENGSADWCALLASQFETTLDGILAVGPKGEILAKNRQFGRLWRIPKKLLSTGKDSKLLASVLDKLTDPDAFLRKVKYLYAHRDEKSFDQLSLADGRTFDRFSTPIRKKKRYVGRIWYFRDSTEKLTAQKNVTAYKNQFQTLFNGTADPIYILDAKGKFLEVNDAAWASLGYTRSQLLKLSVKDVVSPAARPTAAAKIQKIAASGAATFPTEHMARSGKIIPVEVNASPIFFHDKPAIIAVCRDLSERRMINSLTQKAVTEENKFQTIFNNAGDAVFILPDSNVYDKKFIDANAIACEKLGYSRDELLGMTPRDLEFRAKADVFDKLLAERVERMKEQGILFFQVEMRAKDGRTIPFELVSRVAEFSEPKIMVCIARDMTDIKKIRELQELQTLQDDFLNISTHELRTPLTSIIGLSEIIGRDNNSLSGKEREYLNIIHSEGERLARTIKQILEVTRYENKGMPVNKTAFQPDAMIADLKPILESIMAVRHAKISILVETPGQTVVSDQEKISQVIFDMIDNAVKFGPEGQTVTLAVSRPNPKEMMIEVTDQGPGIPENKRAELFKKFGQLDTSFARSQEGIGLGLYTAKMITEALGGRIGVKSQDGRDSTFWFTFPII